jgi:hypothetical protein
LRLWTSNLPTTIALSSYLVSKKVEKFLEHCASPHVMGLPISIRLKVSKEVLVAKIQPCPHERLTQV